MHQDMQGGYAGMVQPVAHGGRLHTLTKEPYGYNTTQISLLPVSPLHFPILSFLASYLFLLPVITPSCLSVPHKTPNNPDM